MSVFHFPSLPASSLSRIPVDVASLSVEENTLPSASFRLFVCHAAKGNHKILVGEKLFPLEEGALLLLPPFCPACFATDKDGHYNGFCLTFGGDALPVLCPTAVQRSLHGSPLLFFNPADKYSSFYKDSLAMFSFVSFVKLLAELEERSIKQAENNLSLPLPLLIQRALKYISHHTNEKVSCEILAERYDVSATNLRSLFRKHLSCLPSDISRRFRYAKAKELLACGIERSKVADALGFDKTAKLTAFFKKCESK